MCFEVAGELEQHHTTLRRAQQARGSRPAARGGAAARRRWRGKKRRAPWLENDQLTLYNSSKVIKQYISSFDIVYTALIAPRSTRGWVKTASIIGSRACAAPSSRGRLAMAFGVDVQGCLALLEDIDR